MELKFQLKKKNDDDKNTFDNLIDDLTNENNELKIELENEDHIIEQLKNENEELNNHLDELNNKFN